MCDSGNVSSPVMMHNISFAFFPFNTKVRRSFFISVLSVKHMQSKKCEVTHSLFLIWCKILYKKEKLKKDGQNLLQTRFLGSRLATKTPCVSAANYTMILIKIIRGFNHSVPSNRKICESTVVISTIRYLVADILHRSTLLIEHCAYAVWVLHTIKCILMKQADHPTDKIQMLYIILSACRSCFSEL